MERITEAMLQKEKSLALVSVGVTIVRETENGKEVLLGLRKGGYQSDLWQVPAGHVRLGSETLGAAAAREIWEETGLVLTNTSLHPVLVSTFTDSRGERRYLNVDFACDLGDGDIKIELKEPDKCERWEWFSVDNLPPDENMHPPALSAIKAYKNWLVNGDTSFI